VKQLDLPWEIVAFYRVPRDLADGWVKVFNGGMVDASVIASTGQYRVLEAEIQSDPAGGSEAGIQVTYRRIDQ
jgi:hypothetical protein